MRGIGFGLVGAALLAAAVASGAALAAVASIGVGSSVGAVVWRVRRTVPA
jgi:hypothetical protein